MVENWFYASNGEQAGPISEPELLRLADTGGLNPDSLVWHRGLQDWLPLGEVLPSAFLSPATPHNRSGFQLYGETASTPYAQSEGLPFLNNPSISYAGFWIRFAARFIDGLVLLVPQMLVRMGVAKLFPLVALPVKPDEITPEMLVPILLSLAINTVIAGAYEIFFLSEYGATLGKKALGLKVLTTEGLPLTTGRSLGRHLASYLSGFTLGIGFLMAAFDKKKRALHDLVASTVVVSER